VGLASTLWRTADLAFARGDIDEVEAALQEARSVLGETQRERWIANTLSGLAEVALLRGDTGRASALLADARERYAARDDAVGVANIEERLRGLAKASAKGGKAAPDRTSPTAMTKGEDHESDHFPVLGEATVQELREAVQGEILTPADDGYLEASRIWNGAHDDRRPALIVRCSGRRT